ncbi:MAG: hypothetical protein M3298_01505, partial [Thermoproteota archaeon]|nr:hypothetical protein [Thermoproteota archaeon]
AASSRHYKYQVSKNINRPQPLLVLEIDSIFYYVGLLRGLCAYSFVLEFKKLISKSIHAVILEQEN